MKKIVTAALIALALTLATSCAPSGTVVEKEYEPAHYDKKKKKMVKECFEIDLDNGREFCTTRADFNRINVGDKL